jgi:hypothetical protein
VHCFVNLSECSLKRFRSCPSIASIGNIRTWSIPHFHSQFDSLLTRSVLVRVFARRITKTIISLASIGCKMNSGIRILYENTAIHSIDTAMTWNMTWEVWSLNWSSVKLYLSESSAFHGFRSTKITIRASINELKRLESFDTYHAPLAAVQSIFSWLPRQTSTGRAAVHITRL